ncbi:hypothetical protein LPJ66_003411 [Kickxella alabastrina]|uniref:Uncharacterized protein n=1 Tax=Kickxella alabastrina TaxID=61397 RepID=A0ACC1IM93_9FUNG|nr:hypothetical protein LPJ66_003411 [Kickxella alabastrina]
MRFTSISTAIALAAVTVQASPHVVTVIRTAESVVNTVVSVTRVHHATKTSFAPTNSIEKSSTEDAPSSLDLSEGTSASSADEIEPVPSSSSDADMSEAAESPSSSSAAPSPTDSGNSDADWITTMVCRINSVRTQRGLQPLGLSPEAISVSQKHSDYQYSTQQMTHNDPAGGIGDRLRNAGISWDSAAENVAAGMETPEEAQQTLENSSGHLANMVSPNMAYFGAGRAGNYYTQTFYSLPGDDRPANVSTCN